MKAYEWAVTRPWVLTPSVLEMGLEIALRRNDGPEVVADRLGKPLDNTRAVTYRDDYGAKIAVVPIEGPIFRHANLMTELSGGVSTEVLARDIRTAVDDPGVAAIVLEADSPGGEAKGIAELAGRIREWSGRKPIVTYVDGAACSGMYWLAAACSSIVTAPTGILGSIGAVMKVRHPKDSPGDSEFVSTYAPMKRADPRTDAGKAEMQALVNALHHEFESAVATYRGVPPETVRSDFGRGGVKVGRAAVSARMADAVGSFESVLEDLSAGKVPGRTKRTGNRKEPQMGWREKAVQALFGGDPDTPDDDTPPTPEPAPKPAARSRAEPTTSRDDPEKAELRRKLAEHEAERRQSRLAAVATDATEFAARMVKEGKGFPAEMRHVASSYARAALDDAGIADATVAFDDASGAVVLTPGTPGVTLPTPDRLGTIKAAYAARTPHGLTEEKIPGPLTALSPQKPPGDDKEFDAAVKDYASR